MKRSSASCLYSHSRQKQTHFNRTRQKKYAEKGPKFDKSTSGNWNLHLLPSSKDRVLNKTTAQMGVGPVEPLQTCLWCITMMFKLNDASYWALWTLFKMFMVEIWCFKQWSECGLIETIPPLGSVCSIWQDGMMTCVQLPQKCCVGNLFLLQSKKQEYFKAHWISEECCDNKLLLQTILTMKQ